MKPLFVAIEGLDGSGGTTQTRLLADWLRGQGGREVVQTFEPSDGPVGAFVRQMLTRDEKVGEAVLPFLFAGDRRDHLDRVIIPALQRGAHVVTDRYYHSSLAYQSLAIGLPRVAELNHGFRAPDVTLFLDLDVEVSYARICQRGHVPERFETIDKLRRISDAYEAVLLHCRTQCEVVHRIDASGTVEHVHGLVCAALRETLAEG